MFASARRTAAWREEIERAARAHGADPDLMEAMVLLESAGRPDVIAGEDPEAASGLAQILASTGTDLLGMRVDLPRSQELTRRIIATEQALSRAERKASSPKAKAREEARRQLQVLPRRVRKLYERRRAIDERFQPEAALDGMGPYLEIARERFGQERLAVASYHMGIGNLETVIDRYVGPEEAADPVGEIVARNDLDYPQIFFDSSPLSHERSWDMLASFGDDSSTYLWRVLAAERIMRLFREDPAELHRLDRLHRAKATAEEVFHPEGATHRLRGPRRDRGRARRRRADPDSRRRRPRLPHRRAPRRARPPARCAPLALPLAAPGGARDPDLHLLGRARDRPTTTAI